MTPQEAIRHLCAVGLPEVQIAARVGTTQPTINRIKHGSTPRYSVGMRLVELAQETAVPKRNGRRRMKTITSI